MDTFAQDMINSTKDRIDRAIQQLKDARKLLGKQFTRIPKDRKTPITFIPIIYDTILGDFICLITDGKNKGKEFSTNMNYLTDPNSKISVYYLKD